MICPECKCIDNVIRTIQTAEGTMRLRRCPKCGSQSQTKEEVVARKPLNGTGVQPTPAPATTPTPPAKKKQSAKKQRQEAPPLNATGAAARAMASAKA